MRRFGTATIRNTALLLLTLLVSVAVKAAEVQTVRLWPAPDHTRLVFDLSGPVEHRLFTLDNPHRVVIDISNAELKASLSGLDLKETPIRDIRSGRRNGKDLRIVLDLAAKNQPRSFDLSPNAQYGHRLVVDLLNQSKPRARTLADTRRDNQADPRRDVVIAIDAGHGGEDPGAIGPGNLQEKKVVLAIARELAKLLEREPGFKPVLIRDGDYYIPLRKRTQLARKAGADLFVSIHADAFNDPRARGASVWVLSERGASSEMGRWLAGRENNTDLVGGVGTLSLEDKDEVLAGVLLDMSMTASLSDSLEVGSYVLKDMGQVAHLHKKRVEQAGFMVLKSPDIPSILVETGFISNPGEARKLKSRSHQQELASALHQGIKRHFTRKPPAMTWLAWQARQRGSEYRVVSGDSLSIIANRNGVSLEQLRAENDLKSDTIHVGQVLRIPAS